MSITGSGEGEVTDSSLWETLKELAKDIESAGGPGAWVREHIVLFIVGAFIEITLQVSEYVELILRTPSTIVLDAVSDAIDGVASIGGVVLGTRADPGLTWELLFAVEGAAAAAGPLGILVWAGFIALVIGLALRLLPPALNALGDTLAGIPLVGGALSGLVSLLTGLLLGGDG